MCSSTLYRLEIHKDRENGIFHHHLLSLKTQTTTNRPLTSASAVSIPLRVVCFAVRPEPVGIFIGGVETNH